MILKIMAYVFIIPLIYTCVVSVYYGGKPERIAAALMLIATILSVLSGADSSGYHNVNWSVFVIDCALFIGLLALSLFANRYWPLLVSALQFVTIWSHLAFAVVDVGTPLAYAVASTIWSLPMLIILAVGAHRHRQREKSNMADLPWRTY